MIKLYTTAALILLLGFAFWYHGERKFNHGEITERTKWQDIALDTAKRRAKAENRVIEDRVVWRDRIKTIEVVPDGCIIPEPILGVHRESGIYTGR